MWVAGGNSHLLQLERNFKNYVSLLLHLAFHLELSLKMQSQTKIKRDSILIIAPFGFNGFYSPINSYDRIDNHQGKFNPHSLFLQFSLLEQCGAGVETETKLPFPPLSEEFFITFKTVQNCFSNIGVWHWECFTWGTMNLRCNCSSDRGDVYVLI